MRTKLFFSLFAFASIMMAQKPIKIQGTIDNKEITKLCIEVSASDQYKKFGEQQSIEVKKGKFTYTTNIDAVVDAVIFNPAKPDSTMALILVPGETLKLTIKGNEYFYDGSPIYKSMNKADMAISPLKADVNTYYVSAIKRLSGMSREQQQAAVKGLQDTLNIKTKAYRDGLTKYMEENPNDEGSLLYLATDFDVDSLFNTFPENIKNGRVGKYYGLIMAEEKRLIEEREKEAAAEQAKIDAKNGTPAPDFTLNDIEGKPLSLSSLKGKYVILDFWGSWCGWCIKGMPDMKKYYEKYSSKLQILGVDCNDSEEAWKAAVKKYELPWLHVYNTKDSSVLKDYEITGFPTKILVDPNGNIAKIIVGEDPAFYTYLDELFGK